MLSFDDDSLGTLFPVIFQIPYVKLACTNKTVPHLLPILSVKYFGQIESI